MLWRLRALSTENRECDLLTMCGFKCRWSGVLAEGYDVVAVSDKSDLYGHCG